MDAWQPTRALRRAVGLICLVMIAAVGLGRPDLVVVVAPLVIGTVWALRRRPDRVPEVTVTVDRVRLAEGEELTAVARVSNPSRIPLVPVVVATRAGRWLQLSDDARPLVGRVPGRGAVDFPIRATAHRWGRHPLGPTVVRAGACDGLLRSVPQWVDAHEIGVFPVSEQFEADEAIPRAFGLAGIHRSQRPGEGGELAGVRPFAPGDRLRRIDWRVSLRTRRLHVTATLSDREAEVVLLLDTLHEAGDSGGVRGPASVLDVTVRGAAAVAQHYLRQGDRVALVEFGPRYRRLPAVSGRTRYPLVQEWLADTQVVVGPFDPARWLAQPHLFAPHALIVAFTPLLDERSAELLARLARAGRFLVAVDTLPPHARPQVDSPWRDAGVTLWELARQNTIDELREHGVPVVAWRGSGSLDQVLRDVSRMALSARPIAR